MIGFCLSRKGDTKDEVHFHKETFLRSFDSLPKLRRGSWRGGLKWTEQLNSFCNEECLKKSLANIYWLGLFGIFEISVVAIENEKSRKRRGMMWRIKLVLVSQPSLHDRGFPKWSQRGEHRGWLMFHLHSGVHHVALKNSA